MLSRDIPGCQDAHPTPHPPPHIWVHPRDRSLQPLYLHDFFLQCCKFIYTKLHTTGWDGAPTPPAHRACSSESGTCTSTASSGSNRVEHLESEHGSSKARGCSSSIMDAHSCDCLLGSVSILASSCPHILPPGGALGFDVPNPSTSLHSSSTGSSSSGSSSLGSSSSSYICLLSPSEESSFQARRWQVLSSTMRSASWGVQGTKFANATTILSSTQLRSLATPQAGTHSTSSLAGSYAKTLPSNMRLHAMQR